MQEKQVDQISSTAFYPGVRYSVLINMPATDGQTVDVVFTDGFLYGRARIRAFTNPPFARYEVLDPPADEIRPYTAVNALRNQVHSGRSVYPCNAKSRFPCAFAPCPRSAARITWMLLGPSKRVT